MNPITAYLDYKKESAIHVALTELTVDNKCAETQAIMDLDSPANKEIVKSLIIDETKTNTEALR